MNIAIQVLSIITLSIIVMTFTIVISKTINTSTAIDELIEKIQNLTIKKAEDIEIRENVELFSPKKSFGSYEHTNELSNKTTDIENGD